MIQTRKIITVDLDLENTIFLNKHYRLTEYIELQDMKKKKIRQPITYKIKKIPQKGNCQFEAVEMYFRIVEKLETSHKDIRFNAVMELEKFKDEYIDFFDDSIYTSYKDYVDQLLENGTWGDNLSLKAIAQAYQLNIKVFSFNSSVVEIVIKEGFPFCNLLYSNNCHYDLIIGEVSDDSFYKNK